MPSSFLQSAKNTHPLHHCRCSSEISLHERACKNHSAESCRREERHEECKCNDKIERTYGHAKLPLKHCWEVPSGLTFKGRGVQSVLSTGAASKSSVLSDLTIDGAATCGVHTGDTRSKSALVDAAIPSKANVHGTDRKFDCSIKQDLNAAVSSNLQSPTSVKESLVEFGGLVPCGGHEHISRWSEEQGETILQREIFRAVLPSTDEVGLQWRISELRIALRASESARMESEQETESLRKYLTEVESAVASLQSRVQELENIISLSSKEETGELDELRAKMVIEMSREAHNQTLRAAKAVAAAREATMELDKVKRHASSLIRAQEEEAERLRLEAAECRILYHARAGQLHSMKEQIEKLEQDKMIPSDIANDVLRTSQDKAFELKKCVDGAKVEAQEKTTQFIELLEAFETQSQGFQAVEKQLKELEQQKLELAAQNQWLAEQVAGLQGQQEMGAKGEHYNYELCKARAVLGAEKQHLLNELANLRSGNKGLQIELAQWQDRYHALSKQVSGMETANIARSNTKGSEQQDPYCDGTSEINCCDVRMKGLGKCDVCSSDGDMADEASSYDGVLGRTMLKVKDMEVQECATSTPTQGSCISTCCNDVKCATKYNSKQHRVLEGKQARLSDRECKSTGPRNYAQRRTKCDFVKDDLLAAAHREIVRLKEVNQCLLNACEKQVQSDLQPKDEGHAAHAQ